MEIKKDNSNNQTWYIDKVGSAPEAFFNTALIAEFPVSIIRFFRDSSKNPGRKYSLLFCSVIVSFFSIFAGCANQLPPGGGEIDKIPPEIVEIYPANGSINFKENYFEMRFSEFVDKRSVKDAIFISPSPGGELELGWNWNGKAVRVTFPKPLKENTTYAVTIGTDLVDINAKNRMASSYNFSFSTGPVIDKGEISGKIYSEKPSGVMLFAYKKQDTSVINPEVLKPDDISQAGDSGYFKLKGLGPGSYRVFAIEDQYRDLLFQPDQDKFGAPFEDISLTEKDSVYRNLNFFMSKYDTVKPRILTAVMTDKHHLLANFNKELDSASINPRCFSIIDSTTGKKYSPVYAFRGKSKNTEVVLALNSELGFDNSNFLITEAVTDIDKNFTKFDYVKLTTTNRDDTTKTSIIKMSPSNNEIVDYIRPQFRFQFEDAFDTTLMKKGITCADTSGKPFKYSLKLIDNASFFITAEEELQPQKEYRIRFDYRKFVNLSGSSLDSVFTYRFKTINGLDFTGVSGALQNVDSLKNPLLVLQGTDKKKFVYIQKPGAGNTFNFERIEPGQYKLWCFYDTDRNGIYSYGSVFSYVPSEKFRFFDKILDLKPRWSVTEVIFDFEKIPGNK